jgi:hypothetical protein
MPAGMSGDAIRATLLVALIFALAVAAMFYV